MAAAWTQPSPVRTIDRGRPTARYPECLTGDPGRAGTMETVNSLATAGPGWLLVATPRIGDPNFRRTVVYLIAHGEEGTVGVVLNRPSETAVHTVLPRWSDHVVTPRALYVGGPVQQDAAMALGVLRPGIDGTAREQVETITNRVVLVDLEADPETMTPDLLGLRIYAGHAGWGQEQLEAEVDEGAWHVLPGLADDVLAGSGTDLWFRVMRRQPFPLALQAYHPGDLHRN